jgi:hypothetical protein
MIQPHIPYKVWVLLYNPGILLGIYPHGLKSYIHTENCTEMFKAALFHKCQKLEATKSPLKDEWINELQCMYTKQ